MATAGAFITAAIIMREVAAVLDEELSEPLIGRIVRAHLNSSCPSLADTLPRMLRQERFDRLVHAKLRNLAAAPVHATDRLIGRNLTARGLPIGTLKRRASAVRPLRHVPVCSYWSGSCVATASSSAGELAGST